MYKDDIIGITNSSRQFFQVLYQDYVNNKDQTRLKELDAQLQSLIHRMRVRVGTLEIEAFTDSNILRLTTGKEMLAEMSEVGGKLQTFLIATAKGIREVETQLKDGRLKW